MRLRQGRASVSDYAIDFQTLATDSGWVGCPLVDAFLHGLAEEVKDALLTRELPDDLDRIITLTIRIDARLEDRCQWRQPRSPPPRGRFDQPQFSRLTTQLRGEIARSSPPRPRGEPEPMVVDQSRVRDEERYQCLRTQACFRCGEKGHFTTACPVKDDAH